MNKLLSIVIPVYKVEDYIDKCLSSLIVPEERLLKLLDIVVINDGTREAYTEDNFQSMGTWHYWELSLFDAATAEPRLAAWDKFLKAFRNLWWDICFHWNEQKLYNKLDEEIERAEGLSGHHAAYGFIIYQQYEKDKAERKRIHEIKKKL